MIESLAQPKRRQLLDQLLSRPRFWTSEELTVALTQLGQEVSQRTVQLDLQEMRNDGIAPIEMVRDGRGHIYRYTQPFSHNESALTEEQTLQINAALQLLENTDAFENIALIRKKLNLTSRQNTIVFEVNPFFKGREFLPQLAAFIAQQQPVLVQYRSFTQPEQTLLIHPYQLRQYNQRWYLCGLQPEYSEKQMNLALDRMTHVQPATGVVFEPSPFDDDYYEDVIGLTVPNSEIEEVHLLFSPKRAQYVLTKPLHGSQKHSLSDDGTLVKLWVKINPELVSQVLSFGADVQVLKPASLREAVATSLQQALAHYGA